MATTVSDDVIFKVIQGSCSFKVTNRRDNHACCTHPMNVDGDCKFMWCPLSQSQYATVIEEDGQLFLCTRTIERRHLPAEWWERVELPLVDGEDIIREKLKYFVSNRILQRCVDRYHRLQEVIDRIHTLRSKSTRSRIVPIQKKEERRLRSREMKAYVAAKLNQNIEEELLKRLNMGVYGKMYDDILNKEEKKENVLEKDPLAKLEFEEAEENIYSDLNELSSYAGISDDASSIGGEEDIEDIVGQFEFKDWDDKKKRIREETKKRLRAKNLKRRRLNLELETEQESTQNVS